MKVAEHVEFKVREVRKVLDVLRTRGNVLVNGTSAERRLQELVNQLIFDGLTVENISYLIDQLDTNPQPKENIDTSVRQQ